LNIWQLRKKVLHDFIENKVNIAGNMGGYQDVVHLLIIIDKNSLWGGLNIQKRQFCVKGILAQDLGFVWGAFQRGFGGIFGLEVERGRFQPLRIPGTHYLFSTLPV
jgi:hypothetical protein